MKAIRLVVTMLICVATLFSIVGCEGSDDKQDSIVGTWRVIANNGKPIVNDVAIFTFNKDGTMESYSNVVPQVFRGTWSLEDGALTVTSTQSGQTTITPVVLNGDTLTMYSSSGGSLVCERQ